MALAGRLLVFFRIIVVLAKRKVITGFLHHPLNRMRISRAHLSIRMIKSMTLRESRSIDGAVNALGVDPRAGNIGSGDASPWGQRAMLGRLHRRPRSATLRHGVAY